MILPITEDQAFMGVDKSYDMINRASTVDDMLKISSYVYIAQKQIGKFNNIEMQELIIEYESKMISLIRGIK